MCRPSEVEICDALTVTWQFVPAGSAELGVRVTLENPPPGKLGDDV
jgi:hypothetical protein